MNVKAKELPRSTSRASAPSAPPVRVVYVQVPAVPAPPPVVSSWAGGFSVRPAPSVPVVQVPTVALYPRPRPVGGAELATPPTAGQGSEVNHVEEVQLLRDILAAVTQVNHQAASVRLDGADPPATPTQATTDAGGASEPRPVVSPVYPVYPVAPRPTGFPAAPVPFPVQPYVPRYGHYPIVRRGWFRGR